jgi:2-polyprenyl-3-methyl-5-hydroxy-6-metoxy-1,4-benzoquinol methylase
MVPAFSGEEVFWEHVQRYRFAAGFVSGCDVLDIACGEGYGSAGLVRAGARSLVGVDISPDAVAHARAHHGIDARVGSAEEMPLGDCCVDVVTSFETIEHIAHPQTFIDECARVLRPNGTLVISTPNAGIYQQVTPRNPFHCSEMNPDEFNRMLSSRFGSVRLHSQRRPQQWFAQRRGFGRLYRIARRIVIPERTVQLDDFARANVVALSSRRQSFLATWLSLDSVRAVPSSELQMAMYIVAVARLPRKG